MTKNRNLMTHSSVASTPKLARLYHPTLNKYSADSISSRSVVICSWICDNGHTFTRAPDTVRKSSKACTECYPYRRVVAGINDLTTTHPEVAKNFSKNNKLPVTSFSKGHRKSVLWNCENGHEYAQEVYIEARPNSGCPICSGQRIAAGVNDLETLRPDLKPMWSEKNPPMSSFTVSSAEKVEWVCSSEHRFLRRVFHQTKGDLNPCSVCPKPIPFEESVASSERLMKIWSEENSIEPTFVKLHSNSSIIWSFKDCGHRIELSAKLMNRRDGMCSECSYGAGSSQEEFLANFISERYDVEIEQRVRILDGREIDIYITAMRKGVEFNGERWHIDTKAIKGGYDSARDMHQWKLNKAEEKAIDLVYVWSHDWSKHRDTVVSALDNWFIASQAPDPILLRLESLNDGAICQTC